MVVLLAAMLLSPVASSPVPPPPPLEEVAPEPGESEPEETDAPLEGGFVPAWEDLEKQRAAILDELKSWRDGDPVPEVLKRPRVRRRGNDPEPFESIDLIDYIHDSRLLTHVVLDPDVEDAVFEAAFRKALSLAGPNEFFRYLSRERSGNDRFLAAPRQREISRRLARRHVVALGLGIRYGIMPPAQAVSVLDRVEKALQRQSFQEVFEDFERELMDRNGWGTRIQSLGELLLVDEESSTKDHRRVTTGGTVVHVADALPRYIARVEQLPPSHVEAILSARRDDVVRLEDNDANRWCLYYVKEVYEGR